MKIIQRIKNRLIARIGILYDIYLKINYPLRKSYLTTRKGKCLKCELCFSGCNLFNTVTKLCKNP